MIEITKELIFGLTVAIGTITPALAIGLIGAKGLEALGRNPDAASKIQTGMILAIAFAEAIAIYVLVTGFIIRFVG